MAFCSWLFFEVKDRMAEGVSVVKQLETGYKG